MDMLTTCVPPCVLSIFTVVGAIFVALFAYRIIRGVYIYFLRPAKNLRKYGEWAIVTGCTDGIGKAIAEQFARKGLNLILVSRSIEKLNEQQQEIESKFKVKAKVVQIDFAEDKPNLLEPVKIAIAGLDIGILVNNVGIAYDHAEYFHELDQAKINKLISVNVNATTNMTYLVLPGMVQRKRGAIINVSSASSIVSEPLYAVYSASKQYINTFSEALHHEYKRFGVHVQAQLPALVPSKLSKIRHASFFILSPTNYARAFVAAIGYGPIAISFWAHALQFVVILALPKTIVANALLSRGLDIRRRALKKKAEATKQQ